MSRKKKPRFATIDFETDPFEFGADIAPFCAGFFDGKVYEDFWGDDCMVQLARFLETIKEPLYLYAHNGGKFDFMFMLRDGLIENPLKIINGRIVSAKIGIHTLRDSYAILPVPLRAYAKDDFDYGKMLKKNREKHKNDILHYLARDCEYLHEFVGHFIEAHGIKLTAAAMAYGELKKLHPQSETSEHFDAKFRPWYFGGRVECIESGILTDEFKVFDVNSMYPSVMRNFNHPLGDVHINLKTVTPDEFGFLPGARRDAVYFADIVAVSNGALPERTKTGISFPRSKVARRFSACSHEIQAGIEVGALRVLKYETVNCFQRFQRFAEFVDLFMGERLAAKARGDKAGDLLAKLTLNSSYGKAGMNPRTFRDYHIEFSQRRPAQDDGPQWELHTDYGDFILWDRPTAARARFNNVAIAASITSAARATLMRALAVADRPVYCDTDSIICRGLALEHSASKLGAWKLEAEGDRIAIAGKKLYALMSGAECVKIASKGVRLSAAEVFRVAGGEIVTYKKEAPALGLNGATRYIERRIRAT
jgi:hypothetical protein